MNGFLFLMNVLTAYAAESYVRGRRDAGDRGEFKVTHTEDRHHPAGGYWSVYRKSRIDSAAVLP